MKEIWKPVIGYENLYEVSNLGNVKSLKRNIILKPSKNRKGYLHLILYKNGKSKPVRIHRLVAEAFIPNPENKPQVNHKNCIKTDNRVENLEWCTNSENQIHAFANYLQSNKGNSNPRTRKIAQYDLNNNLVKIWNSYYDIKNELNIDRSCIWKCCIGKYKQSHGYIWRYAD